MPEIAVGGLFAGHRIEAVAGRGGMGVVYRATQLDLGRTVALKVVAPGLLADEGIRRRFVHESRIAASLEHPNVIPIHYAGESDGIAYIVMRYVDGDDLRRLTGREGRLPPARAATLVAQIAAALDAAHAAGLVHRDVKPANVLVAPGDHAYLTDFGLTKHTLSVGAETGVGRMVGTLDYAAPEQIRGERVDARTDVYALGCLLFYVLARSVPFPQDGQEAKLWAHLQAPPPMVSTAAPGVPPAFDDVIARALAKRPAERYPSAGDLGRAALAAAAGEEPTLTDERTVAEGDAAPVPAGGAGPRRPVGARRPRRWVLGAGIAAGVLGAGLGLLVALGGDGNDRKAKPSRSEPGLPDPIRVLKRPNAVAVAGGRVWVGGFPNDRLMAIDPGTGAAVDGAAPEVGVGISDMAAGAGGLWATISRERQVVRVDPATGRIAGDPIAVDGTPVAVAAGRRDVWVAVRDPGPGPDGKLLRVDPDRARVTATTPVTAGIVDVVVAGSTVWVLSRKPARVIRFQPGSGRLKPVRLGATEAVSLAYGGGALWATVPDIDSVARIDEKTLEYGMIPVGDLPSGVAVLGRDVWVANKGDSTLSRIDLATSRAAPDRIAVPLNPFAIATGAGRLWVTCLGAGRLQPVPAGFRAPAA